MDAWDAVLDDLERRLEAAESGDLARLVGWQQPTVAPGSGADIARAARLLQRQRALMTRLRDERDRTAVSLGALRRRAPRGPSAVRRAPVYLDRIG